MTRRDEAAGDLIGLSVAALRMLLGATAILAPRLALRPWVGGEAGDPATRVLARALGARDLALGAGTLYAIQTGAGVTPWLRASTFSDATDAVGSVLGWRHLAPVGRYFVVAASTGGALACTAAARALKPSRR